MRTVSQARGLKLLSSAKVIIRILRYVCKLLLFRIRTVFQQFVQSCIIKIAANANTKENDQLLAMWIKCSSAKISRQIKNYKKKIVSINKYRSGIQPLPKYQICISFSFKKWLTTGQHSPHMFRYSSGSKYYSAIPGIRAPANPRITLYFLVISIRWTVQRHIQTAASFQRIPFAATCWKIEI